MRCKEVSRGTPGKDALRELTQLGKECFCSSDFIPLGHNDSHSGP